jgi:hypothetical protein
VPGQTKITVPRQGFNAAYWEEFLKGGISGMLSLSKAIEGEIQIDSRLDEQAERFEFVFRPKKRER